MNIYEKYIDIFKKYKIKETNQEILYFSNCLTGPINTNIIKSIIITNNSDNMILKWKNNDDIFLLIRIIMCEISDPDINNYKLIKNIDIDNELYNPNDYNLIIEKIIISKLKTIIINANTEYMNIASYWVRGTKDEEEKWYYERIRDLK